MKRGYFSDTADFSHGVSFAVRQHGASTNCLTTLEEERDFDLSLAK